MGPDRRLYVADGTTVVRVSPEGAKEVVAEGFQLPFGVAVDPKGTVFVADWEADAIFRVEKGGKPRKIAGTGKPGHKDGPALKAEFTHPSGLVLDGSGNLYIKESGRNEEHGTPLRVRKLTPDGQVTTLAAIDWWK